MEEFFNGELNWNDRPIGGNGRSFIAQCIILSSQHRQTTISPITVRYDPLYFIWYFIGVSYKITSQEAMSECNAKKQLSSWIWGNKRKPSALQAGVNASMPYTDLKAPITSAPAVLRSWFYYRESDHDSGWCWQGDIFLENGSECDQIKMKTATESTLQELFIGHKSPLRFPGIIKES